MQQGSYEFVAPQSHSVHRGYSTRLRESVQGRPHSSQFQFDATGTSHSPALTQATRHSFYSTADSYRLISITSTPIATVDAVGGVGSARSRPTTLHSSATNIYTGYGRFSSLQQTLESCCEHSDNGQNIQISTSQLVAA
ncbi:hypothetical protein H6P81_010065 [Aristolochia fimbriata]|uniref:Uncharacterized protein n=1 Tax=Aristolochia fimbriata TaxID=158543 RepID=A0AAV7EPU7_ARIFI|nr:hypothetical protein H6P81_010065 [Aristolochia fimbriata]